MTAFAIGKSKAEFQLIEIQVKPSSPTESKMAILFQQLKIDTAKSMQPTHDASNQHQELSFSEKKETGAIHKQRTKIRDNFYLLKPKAIKQTKPIILELLLVKQNT